MPKGKRTIYIPSNTKEKKQWLQARDKIASNQPLKIWDAIDEYGFTPEEFRLLYCIARHETWKSAPPKKKIRQHGCVISASDINRLTGISRNKIFQILKLFQQAHIVTKQTMGRKSTDSHKPTIAGWNYEYLINPIQQWLTPWDFAELRAGLNNPKSSDSCEHEFKEH